MAPVTTLTYTVVSDHPWAISETFGKSSSTDDDSAWIHMNPGISYFPFLPSFWYSWKQEGTHKRNGSVNQSRFLLRIQNEQIEITGQTLAYLHKVLIDHRHWFFLSGSFMSARNKKTPLDLNIQILKYINLNINILNCGNLAIQLQQWMFQSMTLRFLVWGRMLGIGMNSKHANSVFN